MLKGEIWWADLPRARGSEPAKTLAVKPQYQVFFVVIVQNIVVFRSE